MNGLAQGAAFSIGVIVSGLLLAVLAAFHRRRIVMAGLAGGGTGDGFHLRQAVMVSLAAAGYYGATAYWQIAQGHPLPPVPDWLLASVGGSHAFHLGGQSLAQFKTP